MVNGYNLEVFEIEGCLQLFVLHLKLSELVFQLLQSTHNVYEFALKSSSHNKHHIRWCDLSCTNELFQRKDHN